MSVPMLNVDASNRPYVMITKGLPVRVTDSHSKWKDLIGCVVEFFPMDNLVMVQFETEEIGVHRAFSPTQLSAFVLFPLLLPG